MRGRRNTNLSISSASLSSNQSSPVVPAAPEGDEKGRFLWIPQPPHSNALPSPYAKAERASRQSYINRYLLLHVLRSVLVASVLLIVWLYCSSLHITSYVPTGHNRLAGPRYTISNDSLASMKDGPVIIQDQYGGERWTMSIAQNSSFPLRPQQYRTMCRTSEMVSKQLVRRPTRPSRIMGKAASAPFHIPDDSFVDVAEAETLGVLPSSDGINPTSVVAEDYVLDLGSKQATCARSLTFVMDTDDVGFGHSLMQLWLAYGLAKAEGRAFFLNDRGWPYGRYLSYFPAPPLPPCTPPPASHILPCPRNARHLVVSAATLPWTFGEQFKISFSRTDRHGSRSQRRVHNLLRDGFEALFQLKGQDCEYLAQRIAELRASAATAKRPVLGMHIRRGDRHPFELQYASDYLPLDRFTNAALRGISLPQRVIGEDHNKTATADSLALLLASDDPDMIVNPDLLGQVDHLPSIDLQRSQDRILLASKRTLSPSKPIRKPGSAYVKHVDENSGWEGGFYASLFRGLGGVNNGNQRWNGLSFSSQKDFRKGLEERMRKAMRRERRSLGDKDRGSDDNLEKEIERETKIHEQAQALRELVGRAYLLDMAVLAKADRVVCAVSSASCRMLGVMMGWDAIVGQRWVNVDDPTRRGWTWDGKV